MAGVAGAATGADGGLASQTGNQHASHAEHLPHTFLLQFGRVAPSRPRFLRGQLRSVTLQARWDGPARIKK